MSLNRESPPKTTPESPPANPDIHVDLGYELKSVLNELSEKYYGGNRTQTLRRAIKLLEIQQEEGEGGRRSDDEVKRLLNEMAEELETVASRLESVETELEKSNQDSSLPPHSKTDVSEEKKSKLFDELQGADKRLTVDELIARTMMELVDLSLALGELIDETLVETQETGGTRRYGIIGKEYDNE